jgi:hypothetical protein
MKSYMRLVPRGGRYCNFSCYLFKEPLNVHTTPADAKPGPVSPDAEKSLPTNTESSSTISEKG